MYIIISIIKTAPKPLIQTNGRAAIAQKWCTDFAGTTKGAYGYYGITSAFSKQEAAGLIATVKSDNAHNAGQYNVNFAASAEF